MARRRLTPEQARAELARRLAASPAFSAQTAAGDFPAQLAYLACLDQFAIALCSRRAGKTWANCVLLALVAMRNPEVNCLYVGLTEKAVLKDVVKDVWRRVVRKYKLPFTSVDSKTMTATCTVNGSRVTFGSTDDIAHIEAWRGGSYANGCIVIDECQSMRKVILETLVESIVLPMLNDTSAERPVPGLLRLSGTIPTVAAGYFYHQFVEANGWTKFSWSRFSNVNLTDQRAALDAHLKLLGIGEQDPIIRRDYFGELKFSSNDTAYRYEQARSTYEPPKGVQLDMGPFHCTFAEAPGLDRFVVGIDPANRKDRFAIVCWGWNSKKRNGLFQVAECVTEPAANPFESEWLAIVIELKRRYKGLGKIIYDPGSTGSVLDTLYAQHGIIIEPAIKGPGSLKKRVDRMADLLAKPNGAKVIKGGHLDVDLQTAKWDGDALEKGKWEFDKSSGSPDVSDAASYAVVVYTEVGASKDPDPPSNELQALIAAAKKGNEEMWKNLHEAPRPKPSQRLWSRPG